MILFSPVVADALWTGRDVLALVFLSSNAWVSSSAVVSLVALVVSLVVYGKTSELSRKIADRTVTIEAQKLLLEINKVLVTDPRLFRIYDPKDELHKLVEKIAGHPQFPEVTVPESVPSVQVGSKNDFAGKLAAVGFMMLNVFEIVFAQMPKGPEYETWVRYFEDTLDRCPTIAELLELREAKVIYHPELVKSYGAWRDKPKSNQAQQD